ncbi:MAG TPA: pilus assembly protein PilP [Smithella sp.]|nr:pilus assembly protein PilP [Smithella sp.]HRS96651.1 pilus assembly protein PilP [Smithella sp.]
MKRLIGLLSISISFVLLAASVFADAPKNPVSAVSEKNAKAVSVPAKAAPVSSAAVAAANTPAPAQPKAVPASSSAANISAPTASFNAPLPAPPVVNPKETYSYNPLGKPDPFKAFIEIETTEKKKKEEKKALAATSIFPLQREDTENYRVVGIAGDQEHRVAIVEDAAKKFYPLYKGTRIGLNNGKVVEILQDRVIVEEYDEGKAKRVTLKLHKN